MKKTSSSDEVDANTQEAMRPLQEELEAQGARAGRDGEFNYANLAEAVRALRKAQGGPPQCPLALTSGTEVLRALVTAIELLEDELSEWMSLQSWEELRDPSYLKKAPSWDFVVPLTSDMAIRSAADGNVLRVFHALGLERHDEVANPSSSNSVPCWKFSGNIPMPIILRHIGFFQIPCI
eukprot:GHVT01018950.1.p2 GENE.GHVT01018950.1~~GHVT01018950.1.p2  ORF type:complete len:180 (-),score=40.36 GHVT01018950.1:1299-1838(-)